MLLAFLAFTAAAAPADATNPVPAAEAIHGFWGTSPTEVWAFGDGVLLRWDGREWTRADVRLPEEASCCAISGVPGAVTVVASLFTPESVRGCGEDSPCCGVEPPRAITWTARWDGRSWSELVEAVTEGDAALAAAASAPAPPTPNVPDATLQRLWDEHRPVGDRVPARVRSGHRVGAYVWAVGEEPPALVRFDGRAWHVDASGMEPHEPAPDDPVRR
jgi:hypothetical protein